MAVNRSLARGLKVFKFLGSGQILEWKSLREIAGALGLSVNEVNGALEALVAEGLAEKSDKGCRQSPQGLTFYALEAMAALNGVKQQLGMKQ